MDDSMKKMERVSLLLKEVESAFLELKDEVGLNDSQESTEARRKLEKLKEMQIAFMELKGKPGLSETQAEKAEESEVSKSCDKEDSKTLLADVKMNEEADTIEAQVENVEVKDEESYIPLNSAQNVEEVKVKNEEPYISLNSATSEERSKGNNEDSYIPLAVDNATNVEEFKDKNEEAYIPLNSATNVKEIKDTKEKSCIPLVHVTPNADEEEDAGVGLDGMDKMDLAFGPMDDDEWDPVIIEEDNGTSDNELAPASVEAPSIIVLDETEGEGPQEASNEVGLGQVTDPNQTFSSANKTDGVKGEEVEPVGKVFPAKSVNTLTGSSTSTHTLPVGNVLKSGLPGPSGQNKPRKRNRGKRKPRKNVNAGGEGNNKKVGSKSMRCSYCRRFGHSKNNCRFSKGKKQEKNKQANASFKAAETKIPKDSSAKSLNPKGLKANINKEKNEVTKGPLAICFQCGQQGHIRTNCPQSKQICYNCNQQGHIRPYCPLQKGSIGTGNKRLCLACGQDEHPGKRCSRWEQKGKEHMSFDNQTPKRKNLDWSHGSGGKTTKLNCSGCGQIGHTVAECFQRAPGRFTVENAKLYCSGCGQMGHTVAQCFQKGPEKFTVQNAKLYCSGCGQMGHTVAQCFQKGPEKFTVQNANLRCSGCGQMGHTVAQCFQRGPDKQSVQNAKLYCSGCGQMGHTVAQCFQRGPDKQSVQNAKLYNCSGCGQMGHTVAQCFQRGPKKFTAQNTKLYCSGCGQMGHTVAQCFQKGPEKFTAQNANLHCSGCGQMGHLVADCKQRGPKKSKAKKKKKAKQPCSGCGRFGHTVANCFLRDSMEFTKKQTQLQCSGCGQFGHTIAECVRMPVANEAGSSRMTEACYWCGSWEHTDQHCNIMYGNGGGQNMTRPNFKQEPRNHQRVDNEDFQWQRKERLQQEYSIMRDMMMRVQEELNDIDYGY